jgi:hypothetical protein
MGVRKESGAVHDHVDAIHRPADTRRILHVADNEALGGQHEPSRIVLRSDQAADLESMSTEDASDSVADAARRACDKDALHLNATHSSS